MANYPVEGDRTVVSVRTGYKLAQNRPGNCYYGTCKCEDNCNGTVTEHPGTITKVTYYADNSVEATVACDDGKTRIKNLKSPSGDIC